MSDNSESEPQTVTLEVDRPMRSRFESFKLRLLTSAIMIGGFMLVFLAGHFYCCLLVLAVNICILSEILSLKRDQQRDLKIPYFLLINWYFFFTTTISLGIMFLRDRVSRVKLSLYDIPINQLAHQYFYLLFFGLYVFGLMLFVMSLRKRQLRYQFKMFGWTHITCMLVVPQTSAIMQNIYEGLIWFLLPVTLVVINDSSAYIVGMICGRTPLISISPKKTWEGFIGALIITIISAYFVADVFQSYQYFICPQYRFTLTPFQLLDCERADIFIQHVRELPEIFNYFGLYTFKCSTTQLHAMVLGVFAGFIAPFGGFFASGVKRAFKIKDFGTSIPGHGGITDRMDCQLLMGTFTAVWLNSALLAATSVSSVLNQLYTFSPEEQEYILKHLMQNLQNNL